MKQKKLIVLNLTGALLMPVDEVISVWCDAIRSTGLSPDYKFIYNHFGEDFEEIIIPKMAKEKNWTQVQMETISEYARSIFKDVNTSTSELLPNKLQKLKELGYFLGVISNKSRDRLLKSLLKIGCPHTMFDFVKSGDDGVKKPDPAVFVNAFKVFNADEIIFVGDSPHYDFKMAKQAGIEFIAIVSSIFPRQAWEALYENGKDKIFNSLPDYLNSLIRR